MTNRLRQLARSRTVRLVLWMLLHVILLSAALAGAWWLNRRLDVPAALVPGIPALAGYWLPLLVLLAYAGGWLAWALLRTTGEPSAGDFPDLADAWQAGRRAVADAAIDIRKVPVLLVLGKPAGGPADYFHAAGDWVVRAAPSADAPVQVFASRQLVCVAVPGAGATSAIAGRPVAAPPTAGQPAPVLDLLDAPTPAAEASVPGVADPVDWLPAAGQAAMLKLDPAVVARLQFVAGCVMAARRPFCATNGLVWLLPATAVADAGPAAELAEAVRTDLAAVEGVCGLDLPSTVVMVGAEGVPGFRELAAGLPASATGGRGLGCPFPLRPADGPAKLIADGVGWLTGPLLAGLAYRQMAAGGGSAGWRFAAAWAVRRDHLTRLVVGGLLGRAERPPLVTGVYLAGTGTAAEDRGFAAAPLAAAAALEDAVSWRPAARRADRTDRRLAAVVYLLLATGLAAVAGFGVRVLKG